VSTEGRAGLQRFPPREKEGVREPQKEYYKSETSLSRDIKPLHEAVLHEALLHEAVLHEALLLNVPGPGISARRMIITYVFFTSGHHDRFFTQISAIQEMFSENF
jgi:hypothetical protein